MTDTEASLKIKETGAYETRLMSNEELAMQSLTKQIYKSRLFRGIYIERCFVERLGGYRDVVALQCTERDLEKQLLSSAEKLQLFYQRFEPNMWVGITKGSVGNYKHAPHPARLDTCIWTELNDVAFGEYWFNIKTLRFRLREVEFKLKIVRAVEADPLPTPRPSLTLIRRSPIRAITASDGAMSVVRYDDVISEEQPAEISLSDFLGVLHQWRQSVVTTIYEFMANDVNKRNILGIIRFFGLLIISILGGAAVALRFMGIFTVRFLFELSRLTHTATPIILKLIEFLNKIVGAVFVLIAMMWRDLVVHRGSPTPRQPLQSQIQFKSIAYDQSESPHRSQTSLSAPYL